MCEYYVLFVCEDICVNIYVVEFFEYEYCLDYFVYSFVKFILCWGYGIVMGGGIGLMVGCSYCVVIEKLCLVMLEIIIGFYLDVGGSWFLVCMLGKIGIFLVLIGVNFNVNDVFFVGLVDYCVVYVVKVLVIDVLLM